MCYICYLQYFYTGWLTHFGTILRKYSNCWQGRIFHRPIHQMEYCSTMDHPRYDLSKLPTYTYELLWNIFHCIDQLHTILNILANFRRVMNIATNHMNTLLFEKSSSLCQVSNTKNFRIFENLLEFSLKPSFMLTIFTAPLCHKRFHGINHITVIVGQILGDRAKFFFVFHFHDFISIELIKKLTWIQNIINLLSRSQSLF